MKASLPILAALALAGATAAAHAQLPAAAGPQTFAPPAGPAGNLPPASTALPRAPINLPLAAAADSISGQALLRRALAELDAQGSIAAKVRFKVEFGDQVHVGTGVYRQQGRGGGRRLRFELELDTSGRTHRLQNVCDGQALWILEDIAGKKSLGRVDLARVSSAQAAAPRGVAPSAWLAIGGLPRLLASLDDSFVFEGVAEDEWKEPDSSAKTVFWTIEGTWRPARLVEVLPEQQAAIASGRPADLARLPPNLPDRVVLHFGAADFFPYRIEYRRRSVMPGDAAHAQTDRTLVLMELFEVDRSKPIEPAQFHFEPGSLQATDRTAAFLEKLGLQENAAAAKVPVAPRR